MTDPRRFLWIGKGREFSWLSAAIKTKYLVECGNKVLVTKRNHAPSATYQKSAVQLSSHSDDDANPTARQRD